MLARNEITGRILFLHLSERKLVHHAYVDALRHRIRHHYWAWRI